MKPKSDLENLIKCRDAVAERLCYARADVLYWQDEYKRAKTNSQEKVNADNMLKDAKERVRKDTSYLKCFDQLIAK